MNYTKRRIKKHTHRKININRKTNNRKTITIRKRNNRKIMRKTRRNFKGRRVMTGGTCQYFPMFAAKKYEYNVFEPMEDRQDVRFIQIIKPIEEIHDFLSYVKTFFNDDNEFDSSFGYVQTKGLNLGPFLYNGLADPRELRKTFYFNLLKYVVCNYINVITEFSPVYIKKLFWRLEEDAITGMFPLYIEDKEIIEAYENLGVDECSIGNTIITTFLDVTGLKEEEEYKEHFKTKKNELDAKLNSLPTNTTRGTKRPLDTSQLCKTCEERPVASGTTNNGNPYTTCCRKCATYKGTHSHNCNR